MRRILLFTFLGAFSASLESSEPTPKVPGESAAPPKFVRTWGKKGGADGEFHVPINIAVNKTDVLFVTDLANERVQKFDADGKFLAAFKVPGKPSGIAVNAKGEVFVSLWIKDRIAVFTESGTLIREWGKSGRGDGEFRFPASLAIGPDGNVYLGDDVNRRVQKFSADGKFLTKWGKGGSGPGEFGGEGTEKLHPDYRTSGPAFLTFSREGILYATDGRGGKVHRFTSGGKFISSWGSNEDKPGGFGGRADLPGPTGICIDQKNRVWVASTNNRIQLFTADGEYLLGFGKKGEGPGEFHTPHGLTVDSRGNLYVVDTTNNRIQKFAP